MSSDFHRVEFGSRPASAPPAATPSPVPAPVPDPAPAPVPQPSAPESVLVPLDQWNRLLGQLGNVHEAGQQLAEARERMGRAETENVFLKERIRDLRTQLEPEPAAAAPPEQRPAAARHSVKLEVRLPPWVSRLRKRAK